MPDSIGVPSFDERLDADVIYERASNEMKPEEIKEVDAKFKELYPDVHEITLKSFSEKMGLWILFVQELLLVDLRRFS